MIRARTGAGRLRISIQMASIIAALLIVLAGTAIVGGVAVPVGAILALVWVRLTRTPWQDVGYARPRSWIAAVAGGFALGIAFKFLMKAIVMPLLGADPVNHAFHYLAGNRAMLPAAIWMMFVAGFGEETVFRGFLFERLGKLLGESIAAKVAIVVLTSAVFGAAHYQLQGVAGVEQATIFGIVLGTIYAITRRVALVMCAHAAFDLTALAMIYWNAEAAVAHLYWR